MEKLISFILTCVLLIQSSYAATRVNTGNRDFDQRQNLITLLNGFRTPQDLIQLTRAFVGEHEAELVAKTLQEYGVKLSTHLAKVTLVGNSLQMVGTKDILFTFDTSRMDRVSRNGREFQFDAKIGFEKNLFALTQLLTPKEKHGSTFNVRDLFSSEAYAGDDITNAHDENRLSGAGIGAAALGGSAFAYVVLCLTGLLTTLTIGPAVLIAAAIAVIVGVIAKLILDHQTDSNYKQFAFNCPKDPSGIATLNLAGNDIKIQFSEGKVINYDMQVGGQKTTYFVDRDWNFSGIQSDKHAEFPLHSREYSDAEKSMLGNMKTLLQVCAHPEILAKVKTEMAQVEARINSSRKTATDSNGKDAVIGR